MKEMKSMCEDLTQSMVQSSHFITALHDKCIVYCRSNDNSRASSIGIDLGDMETTGTEMSTASASTRRLVYMVH